MTLFEIKEYLRIGHKKKLQEQLENLHLQAISAQADSKGLKKTSKELEKMIDSI